MSETIGDIIKNSIAEAASQASFAPQISGLDIAAKDIDEYEAKAKIAAERTAELEREVTTLRDAMNGLKDEKGVTELEAKVSRFTKTMTAAKKEVEAFLIQEQLIGSKNENIGAYKKYIDQVAEGYKTASQVITQIKADLNMAGNDGGAVDSGFMKGLLATLSQISESIDSVKEKIDSLKQDGITISGGDAAVNSGKSFTNMLEAIEQSSEKAGEDISETRKQMVDLLTAVNAFANVDNSKLFAVTEAFKGMANIGEGSFGSKSLNNLIDSVKKLQEVSANGGAIQLVFDIQGIQDLKVRKTSLNNLATYLPIISQRVNPENIQKIFAADPTNGINNLKVGKSSGLDLLNEKLPALSFINVDNLKALFGIDTSGINSLKVSKASVANVEKLALAAQILRENNVDLTFQGDVTEELKEIANNIGLTKDEAKETDTALDNVKNTIDETTVSANKLGDSVQEALEPLSGITVKRPAVSDFKGSITDALRDEYHMEATDIDKVTQALGVQEGQLKKVTAAHREYVDGTEKIQHVSSVTVQTVRDLGDGIQKVSTSVADFNPIRDDDGNIINWGVAITRGYEQISVAAKEAADAQEDFVDKGKAIKELQGLQVDIQRSLDKAAANGVVDNEAIDRLRACQQTYSDFENVVRDNNITLTNYKAIMDGVKGSVSEANKELGFSVDLQRAEAAAAKEAASAQEDFVDKGKAINELQGLQSDIQKSIDDAASKGIVDNESLDRLRTYQQTFSDLEDVVRNNDVSLSNYKAITDAVRSSVTEANKELGFSVQLYREDEAAAKAAAKAEAELANTVQARGAIGKATAGVDKTVSGAQAVGVSVDNADLQQLAVYRQLLAELDAELDDLNLTQKEFSTIMGNLKAIFQAPEAAVKKLTASLKEQQNHIAKSAKIYDAVKSATEEYADAQNDSNSNVRAAYTVITNLRRELDGAAASYKNGKITAAQYDEAVKSTNDELNEQVKVLKNAGYGADETASKFAQLTQQLTRFITPLYLARKAWQTVKEMANVVIELEDAFAQLQIVTGATDDELEEFYETSAKIAADLGKSITDIAASIEVFSRLGYSLPDATQLAQYATILSNVAGVSTDEATTGLTSIIKGYNMHVEKAEHVSDVLISIGQKYAVSAGEMMEAYERSGAALAATNTSFEKSAAIIAAANAAIQNSSTVGTALKTISARIRGSKSDLEELGEDTEELANGFSKYADELKALTGVNIMVEGTTDQFKDLYEIMDDIAGVWGNLTDTQQARTAEILGGTRQLQVIASIISNWGDAERALVDAENSAGEAARANSIYMDTTTAHMNQFKAAFQDLSHTVIESDLLKAFVDLGTNLLNAANSVAKFIDSLGGIIPVLTAIAGLLMVFKADAITGLLTKVGGAIASFASSAVSALTTVTTVGVKGVTTLEMVEGAATAASTGFSSLVPVLGVVTFAIATLATTINQVKAKQAELREESIKLGEAAAKEGDELVDLADKYVDLAKTSSDNDAILEARNEIIDKLGLERSEVEGLVREYGNYEDAIRHATAEQLKAQRSTLVGGLNAAREGLTAENFGRYQDTRRVSWGNDNAQGNLDAIAALQNAGYLKGSSSTAKSGTFAYDFGDVSTYKDVLNVYQQLHSMMQLLVNDGNANTAVYQDIYNLYNEMGSAVNDYNTALQNLLTNELQQNYLNSQIPQTTAEYQSLRAEMIQAVMSASEFGLEMDEAVLAVDEFLSTQSDLSQFASNIDNAFASIHDGAGALASVRSEFDGIKDIFDGVTESLKGINDVQALVADGFAVDVEKAMELAEAYPQILDSATVTADGQLLLNEEVVNSFINTKQGEINAAIEAKIAELEGDKALLLAKKELAEAQLQMAQQVANGEAELTAAQLQNRLDNSNKVVQALIEMGISEADAYKAVYEAMSKNASIFDGNVADVASDIAANMASASSSMATGFNSNVVKMNNGMRILVGNAHQVAAAVSAMGKGEKSGAIGYTDGGGNGQSINTFGKQLTVRGFTGANVSYKANNLQVSGIIKQLETDISGYTSAIAAIEGQIAALNAIRNNANAKIAAGPSTSGSGGRGGSGGGGGGGGGGGSGSGSGSSEKEETWFEKQYKLHQHYLNMDQETTQDFLKWLEKAYKQAYKEGIITLDEYYKYEEEIYKSYQKIKDAAKSTFDALVDYRVKMLKTDRENQKKAINDQLNDLKDFYSKQKELLQKQADDEKYYDEQSEKRKDVNDIKSQIAQLQYDNSAWAAKRRAELYEQLAEAEKSLKDFEDDRALQEALDALDDAYNAEEERLNKEIEAIEDVLNDPEALYNQALQDIQNNTEDLFKAFLLFNKKYGDGDDESIIKMWEEAFKNSEAFKSIFGSYYNDTKIGNYTGYTPPTPPTNPQPPTSSGSSNSGSNNSKPASKPAAPSLASGSTVQVKTSATHFSPKSGSVRMASFVPGGQYTVYQTSGNEVLIGRGGVYTGWIYKSDIVGYKKGTKNATPGLHRVDEEGTEAIFTSGTGDKYRMFSGGEKVLPAKATNFLYEFAMAGAEILDKMKGSASETFSNRGTINQPVTVTMGDIIINGDTNQATVSEIRRAQREQVNDVLKAFNRYQITLYRSAK